jgi:signal transduction histidine kinase
MKSSLRNKAFTLLFTYAVVLVSFFGLAMVFATYVIEDEVITQRLLLEAKYLKKEYVNNSKTLPRGKHFALYFELDDFPEVLKKQVENNQNDIDILIAGEKKYRYFHFYVAIDREAYLVVDISEISLLEGLSGELIVLLGIFIILTLILSIWLTLLINNNTIKPLIELTNAIKRQKSIVPILPKNLLSRNDELGYLSNILNNSYNKLSLALNRESEFTRDVSHELRTPISVMLNTLTISHGEPLSVANKSVLERQVKLMNSRVDILLALARAESMEKKSVNLLSVVEESILSIHKIIEEKKFKIVLDIPLSIKINANEHLMKLMMCNLIENAIKYSSADGMKISGSQSQITVSNSTDLYIDNDLVEKYKKAADSEGLGQGLFLVSRILESMEWTFELKPSKTVFDLKIIF